MSILLALDPGRRSSAQTVGCLLWIFLALPLSATSSAPTQVPTQYSIHYWQAEEHGLPQNAVTAVLQSRDGYLWIGTYSGLVRFDGVQFKVYDNGNTPELQSSRVTSLCEDADGNLWIGHESGAVTRYTSGQFHSVKIHALWNRSKIAGISFDSQNDVWLMNQEGLLARVRDGLVLTPPAGIVAGVVSLCRAEDGTIWIDRDGHISRLDHGKLSSPGFNQSAPDWYVQGICASRDGGLWVANNGRLREWKENQWTDDLAEAPWGMDSLTAFLATRNGCLAAGTIDHGLHLVLPDKTSLHFGRTNGLSQDWIRTLGQDREGDLWVGTGSGGLNVLRRAAVATISPPDQWDGRAVLSVMVAHDGALWVGTEGAGLYRRQDGEWTHYDSSAGLPNLFVWSVAEDAHGQIWAGTWGGGLLRKHGERFEREESLPTNATAVTALLAGPKSDLWIGTTTGLLRRDAQGRYQSFGREQGLDIPDVRTVLRAPDGIIWFGMLGGGLGQIKEGQIRQFRKADGLSSDFVQCLRLDPDGTLWIGTAGGGLNRLRQGRFAAIGTAQGFPNNVICHIEADDHGYFWVSSYGGIFRVSEADLNACADGTTDQVQCLTYGRGEGMPTLECSGGLQPSGWRTTDGRFWFPTSLGLVAIDPDDVQINPLPPPVVIESMQVEGEPVALTNNAIRISPGKQRFELRYAGLSFVAPNKVRFRHILEGLDNEWVDAKTERSVNYSHVPPGDYTFRVVACNNDGVWNKQGASLEIVVLPHFWQTWWFRGLAGVGIMGVVAWGVRFDTRRRMRRKLELSERQSAIERERARIAKDIHDDLGASLTRISMLSQTARGELDDLPQTARDLERIYSTARELTRAMDEIVWAVNPQHDTLDSLASYLCRFAQDFLAPANIRCRLDVPMHLPSWPVTAEVRHNVFLASKEALNNVVKHAAATEVRFTLALESSAFVLNIEDNGNGSAPRSDERWESAFKKSTGRGNGLLNMRRRLDEIGGEFQLKSTPGQGTTLLFRVPVRHPEPS